ncbi:uncharacterized protein LOC135133426 isoform X2 [Zophobas morio]|uniref:uncharacterized protein LOC135133426 isoform X2 n=1 Tax=Zophobas morio TaxID=2755281 RepID=UPI003082AD1B
MSKMFLVIILSIQLLTVMAFYPESYDVDIYAMIKRSLYLQNILEDSCQLKMCRPDFWCVEKEKPIKIHQLINRNEQLIMSDDNETSVTCIFCFNPEKFEPAKTKMQEKEVQLFRSDNDCYNFITKRVPDGCNCS